MGIYAPIVVLVGGTATGKSTFYSKYGCTAYHFPSVKCGVRVCPYVEGMPILVDTPGLLQYRDHDEYSWQGYFYFADLIVNFGNWSEKEVYGIKHKDIPILDYTGTPEDMIAKIIEFFKHKTLHVS